MALEVIISLAAVFLLLKLFIHLSNIRCKSKTCLVGKTALITGGNSGLGLELVKQLASRGCTVIIADKDDATRTVSNVIEETHNPNIIARKVDFTSFKSVRSFAEDLKQNLEKLDILVNNAGIGNNSPELTEDGIQRIIMRNYKRKTKIANTHPDIILRAVKLVKHEERSIRSIVGEFEIPFKARYWKTYSENIVNAINEIRQVDLLLKSAPSRIIYTSSIAAYVTDLSETNFKSQPPTGSSWWSIGPYGNSKLAGAIMSKILSEKLEGTGVTSNTYHPGICKTNIWKAEIGTKLMCTDVMWTRIFGKTTEEGVQTLLHLICADEVKNISGKFFMECTSVFQPLQVYNEEFCNTIWSLSEKYTNLKKEEQLDAIIQQWSAENKSNILL